MPMNDPLHWDCRDPHVLWSPGNVSEAIPGVSTALNWSFVGDAIELASRRAFASIGVLSPAEVTLPARAEDRFIVAFFGRTVANIDQMRVVGDRLPGTSANSIEEQLFGVVRPGVENHPSYRRWPAVTVRLPATATRLKQYRWGTGMGAGIREERMRLVQGRGLGVRRGGTTSGVTGVQRLGQPATRTAAPGPNRDDASAAWASRSIRPRLRRSPSDRQALADPWAFPLGPEIASGPEFGRPGARAEAR
jgi:hypothetical protein